MTEDKDSGDLAFRQTISPPGIVLLRIFPARRERKCPRLSASIEKFAERLEDHYAVVHEGRFRFRLLRPAV